MKLLYYPGCSLKCSGRAFEESLLPVFEALGVDLEELADWNCCGATAYSSVDERDAYALALRNLAIAEKSRPAGDGDPDLVAPCAACYMVLTKAQHYTKEYPEFGQEVSKRLADAGLPYQGRARVRHPLDVLVNQVGLPKIRSLVRRPLTGLKVASYYGCQLVRPYALFDDQDNPTTMDRLMVALGAESVAWPLKTRCCGGSLMGTITVVGARLSHLLIQEALNRGADILATACPLCQFNLECEQKQRDWSDEGRGTLPIAFFTQLLGYALGIPERKLGFQRLLVPLEPALAAVEGPRHD
jgi:heterodisulfide reductase subunit B